MDSCSPLKEVALAQQASPQYAATVDPKLFVNVLNGTEVAAWWHLVYGPVTRYEPPRATEKVIDVDSLDRYDIARVRTRSWRAQSLLEADQDIPRGVARHHKKVVENEKRKQERKRVGKREDARVLARSRSQQ